MMHDPMYRSRTFGIRNPMALEWLSALDHVRMKMRRAADDETLSEEESYFTLEPVMREAPEPWQYTDPNAGRQPALPFGVSVPLAVLGGLAGAATAATVWGALAYIAGSSMSYLAIPVGLAAGIGAVAATRGRRGLVFQLIAFVAALAGVVVGNYMAATLPPHALMQGASVGNFFETIREVLPVAQGTFLRIVSVSFGNMSVVEITFLLIALWTATRMAAPPGNRRPTPIE